MEGGEEEHEKTKGCWIEKDEMKREGKEREELEMREGKLSHFITSGYIG